MNKKELIVFLVLFVSYAYFFHPVAYDNADSRIALVYSVVNDGRLRIDKYHDNTDDKSFFKGHYYSDKAIGTSLLGIPVYTLLKLSSELFGFQIKDSIARYVIRVFSISLLSAFMGVLLFRFLGFLVKDEISRWLLTLSCLLGTNAFTYSTMFYAHQLTSVLIFSTFYLIFKIKRKEDGNKKILLCGFLSGYMVITEYPTILILPGIFLYLYFTLSKKKKVYLFIPAFLVPVFVNMIYNYLCFEHPFAIAYSYHVLPQRGEGIMGITGFSLKALFVLLFSPSRGIFFLSPFLVLAFPGFYRFYKHKELRKEFWFSLYVVVFYILLIASLVEWEVGWGWGFGPRHLVPIVPFMVIGIAFLKDYFRRALKILALFSVAMVLTGTVINPHVPDIFVNPVAEFFLPLLKNGYMAKNFGMLLGLKGIYSLIPLFVFIIAALAVSKSHSGGQRPGVRNGIVVFGFLPVLIILCCIFFLRTKDTSDKHYYLGRVYDKNMMFEQAEKEYIRATRINQTETRSYHNLGLLYEKQKMHDKAEAAYKGALKINYSLAEVHNDLAVIYWNKGMHREAVEELKIAIELKPDYIQARKNYELAIQALK